MERKEFSRRILMTMCTLALRLGHSAVSGPRKPLGTGVALDRTGPFFMEQLSMDELEPARFDRSETEAIADSLDELGVHAPTPHPTCHLMRPRPAPATTAYCAQHRGQGLPPCAQHRGFR